MLQASLLLPIAISNRFDSVSPFFPKNDQIDQILVGRHYLHLVDIFQSYDCD